ncbi:uncharacterized protein LOC132613335 [Lycium barbarum]|uniref:uncharacterized protein LOC132613335 n=1 Tax=Lycium barbarum TaxID=112863 RepID=UPI00293ECBE8|nr:uncharacterized protein LOC132613335 [Lycium barbarum]
MITAIIWNIRFVKSQHAFQRLINLKRQYNSFIVALMEPFQHSKHLQKYRRRIGMETALTNINGKIWVFIDAVVQWEILLDTNQQISLKLKHIATDIEMIATFVYAKCSAVERLELWDNIYSLANDMSLPWLVGGDFNVILSEEEKIGGLPVDPSECDDFAFCVNSSELFDMGFKGSPYTWWNRRAAGDCILKILDRILVNIRFQNSFPNIEVEHLTKTGSDHSPMVLFCGEEAIPISKPFRFLNFWTQHESFQEVIKNN